MEEDLLETDTTNSDCSWNVELQAFWTAYKTVYMTVSDQQMSLHSMCLFSFPDLLGLPHPSDNSWQRRALLGGAGN